MRLLMTLLILARRNHVSAIVGGKLCLNMNININKSKWALVAVRSTSCLLSCLLPESQRTADYRHLFDVIPHQTLDTFEKFLPLPQGVPVFSLQRPHHFVSL